MARVVIIVGRVRVERKNQQLDRHAITRPLVSILLRERAAIQIFPQPRVIARPVESNIRAVYGGVRSVSEHAHGKAVPPNHLVVLHFQFRHESIQFRIVMNVACQVRLIWQREIPNIEVERKLDTVARIRSDRYLRFVVSRRRSLSIARNINIYPDRLVPLVRPDIVEQVGNIKRKNVRFREQLARPLGARDQRIGIPTGTERIILGRSSADVYVPLLEKLDTLFRQRRSPGSHQVAIFHIHAAERSIAGTLDDQLKRHDFIPGGFERYPFSSAVPEKVGFTVIAAR